MSRKCKVSAEVPMPGDEIEHVRGHGLLVAREHDQLVSPRERRGRVVCARLR
jgi:hypothetical protein